jgi:triacylglycerol lipase
VAINAQFAQTKWSDGGDVHLGFAKALHGVYPCIQAWLLRAQPARLLVTGHSLGEAFATLIAKLAPSADLYILGCPRVGYDDFVKLLATRAVKRLVNFADLVTFVPPARSWVKGI